MSDTLRSIRLKLVTGYILLVTLFVVVLSLIYCEHDKMVAISVQAKELSEQRRQTEQIAIQLLDLSFQSEQMVGVREDDFEIYKCKRDSVVSSLEVLRLRLNNPAQCARIDSVLFLLQAKEEHLFAILKDVRELREGYDLVEKRIPNIIRQTNHQSEVLSERLQENIEKGRKQASGIKGLFRSKKKSREQIEQENEIILRNTQKRQSGTLRVLADEIAGTHKANTLRLISHVDSLTVRNTYLNKQIRRLITEFGIADRDIRENVIAKELFGRKQAIMTISVFSIVALLLAIVFYILLHRDIQERYRNRIRLERSNNRNEELLAARKNMMLTVSHDLRAPLAAINGYAELLPDERRKENRLHYTEAILQSSGRMLSLLNTLLDYYRLDTGKEQPESRPFHLQSLADMLAAEYAPLAAKKQLELTTHYDGEDVIVAGDRERILQIAGNLLSNAVKFTRTGTICLNLEYGSGDLLLRVEDTGAGMTEEQTKRIFEPFERLGNSETEEGFGLGLSITLALVELLKGRIDVQSRPGVGTVFTVHLPLPVCNEENLFPQSTEPDALPADLRVVVVDNDVVLLTMTVEMFSRTKIHAEGCRSARELMECIRTQRYDLVLTDIMMPDVNGFELLELLRTSNNRLAKTVPVVAMTARAECGAEEFQRAGFTGCLYKPFSRAELFAVVRQSVRKQENKPICKADFSMLLAGENNGKEMLELLAQETKKNMDALADGLINGDRKEITSLLHQLLPLWEVLRIDAPLQELRQALFTSDIIDHSVRTSVEAVLTAGEQLVVQAQNEGGRL